ncbi:MAG: hypothetical protein EOP07_11290 [Proteobacteria bacterium]|nr:MAG: hypothetical protein EOP07_11290 [Pseudomonadota bacterium]
MLSLGFWTGIEKAFKSRDYLFKSLEFNQPMEVRLKERLLDELRAGRLKLGDLEYLNRVYAASQREEVEIKGLLSSYTTHIGFVLFVPLLFRLLLSGKAYYGGEDIGSVLLALGGMIALSLSLLKMWPRTTFAESERLWDFVVAYLGDREAGHWKEAMENLNRQSWMTGIDCTAERKVLLEDWRLTQTSLGEQRRKFLENCLGPLELLMTVYFGSVFVALPLLSHFSGLVPG